MLTNDNYFCKATGIADKWRFDADSISVAVMPMFHMAGSGWALVGLYEGARTVVLRDAEPAAILEAVARQRYYEHDAGAGGDPDGCWIRTGVAGDRLLQRANYRLRRLADHRRRSGQGARAVQLRVSCRCTG